MCGLPTVGTSVGYIADWSPDAAIGVETGDDTDHADGLAAAVLALLADSRRREALGREAMRRAREHDADWTAAALEDFYAAQVRTA